MSFRRVMFSAVFAALGTSSAAAAAFVSAGYDKQRNELVVTLVYRGTNPNHDFTLQWGKCVKNPDARGRQEIDAQVLDSQWNDHAEREYRKTVRFDLAPLACRPADVTLRTAPGFIYNLFVP